MPRILVLDGISEQAVNVFKQAGYEVDVKPAQKPPELAAIIGDYEAMVVRSGTKVTAEALEQATQLKVIGRAGVGTDNIDKAVATEKGVVVMNTPGGNTISTCEHAFALLLSLCRNIPRAHASMEAGRWDRKLFMGSELRGKTLGVVGVGRIGGEVVKRAKAFEMKVLAFDPLLTQLKAEALGVKLVSFDDLLGQADFISIHAPKSDKTTNMIRAEHMRRMKPTCRIINCARGGIVNEADLAEALKEGIIGGAALDVYTSEPFENNPFIGLDNVIMTPHLAASTGEAQLSVAVDVARQVVDFLETGAIVNAVNVPSLDSETRKQLQPLLELAEQLGKFLSLYTEGVPDTIDIEYVGDLGISDTYPLTAAVIAGYLSPMVESVNMVSAPSMLKARGINSSEKRSARDTDYAFEIGVSVTTSEGGHSVHGTLFSEDPIITSIDRMRIDTKLEGVMVLCENEDVPLMIGRITTLIGEAGVNIANLVLGRDKRGGRALTVLNVDQQVDAETLDAIRNIRHVLGVRALDLT
ncbi:MAG: phosphoglycerate dehydrogenase [Candidatus Hydrogenedentota bacterium]